MTVLNFLPLYKADKCFDRITLHNQDTVMYIDPITRQTFNYATPNPAKISPKLSQH